MYCVPPPSPPLFPPRPQYPYNSPPACDVLPVAMCQSRAPHPLNIAGRPTVYEQGWQQLMQHCVGRIWSGRVGRLGLPLALWGI